MKSTLSVELDAELLDRLEQALVGHPYRVTLRQAVERGVDLALKELSAAAVKQEEPKLSFEDRQERLWWSDYRLWETEAAKTKLPVGLRATLKTNGLKTVDDLAKRTARETLWMPNVGRKSIRILEVWMKQHGVAFAPETNPIFLEPAAVSDEQLRSVQNAFAKIPRDLTLATAIEGLTRPIGEAYD